MRLKILALLAALFGAGAAPSHAAAITRACDDGITRGFRPDRQTKVLLVKSISKGEPLSLDSNAGPGVPTAKAALCVVKLNVGPGNPGPAGAPSTSPGIGIEIWLPAASTWNGRIHVSGGGGWAGGTEGSTATLALALGSPASPAEIAGVEGAVSASTDTGHSAWLAGLRGADAMAGSFAFRPDGSANAALWRDFSERAIHEMAVKTKALTRYYYGRDARYAYWDGFSTGGRQGLKEAQVNPRDFDGILAGAPAINWTRFITTELYPQIVMRRDLGKPIAAAKLQHVSQAAIAACDVVGGVHLGFIPDPRQCRYDPVADPAALCPDSGGTGAAGTCVTLAEATAINKIWYGQTRDGGVPSPRTDNGTSVPPSPGQLWYGLTRGTMLLALAGDMPFPIATDLVAMELGDPAISTPLLRNGMRNGADGWRQLDYAGLARAFDQGLAKQAQFARINTDDPDLSPFRARGGKILMYHGLADVLIPPQGSIHYYERVIAAMGGLTKLQQFYRFYLIPGMSHSFGNGTANPQAIVPVPEHDRLYRMLTDWVERDVAPARIDVASTGDHARSFPLCLYPEHPELIGSDPFDAASYRCTKP